MSVSGAQRDDEVRFDDLARSYDALLVLSFGGPEAKEEVMPFLERVAAGRTIPRVRLEEVAEHYYDFGGVSPINAQNRALIAALDALLQAEGPRLPIYFGNRNWRPLVSDTVRQMRQDGVRRALVFVTSAFSSYSGCRQYREDLMQACTTLGDSAPRFDKLRVFYNHPGFIEPMVEKTRRALAEFPPESRGDVSVLFTAHSVPLSMARGSEYVAQLEEASRLVAAGVGMTNHHVVYQSRSGPPHVPWLEPDVCDQIKHLAAQGGTKVVLVPIGFISDHMEVVFDLDTQARTLAADLGVQLARAETVGTDPLFMRMIRELMLERMSANPTRRSLGTRGPSHDLCPITCCLKGEGGRPAVAAP